MNHDFEISSDITLSDRENKNNAKSHSPSNFRLCATANNSVFVLILFCTIKSLTSRFESLRHFVFEDPEDCTSAGAFVEEEDASVVADAGVGSLRLRRNAAIDVFVLGEPTSDRSG